MRWMIGCVLVLACAAPDADDALPADSAAAPAADTDSAADTATVVTGRPATIEDTVLVEGTPEVSRGTLVHSPAGFGLPFSTYVPEGMIADTVIDADGDALRIHAAFGGVENRNAFVHVLAYADDTQPVARTVATNLAGGAPGIELTARDAPAWATESVGFRYTDAGGVPLTGAVTLAQRNGRWFHIATHFPAEYGDGMGPRVARILEHWRWDDDGEPLLR